MIDTNELLRRRRQEQRAAALAASMGTRLIVGYLLSAVLIVLSIIQACGYHSSGDTENMIGYIALAAVGVLYAVLVTCNLARTTRRAGRSRR